MLIMLWVHVKCGCACTFTCATSGLDIKKYAPGGSTLEMGELTFVLLLACRNSKNNLETAYKDTHG